MTDHATRAAQADALGDAALAAGPSALTAGVEVLKGLADLLTGRKVISVQAIERPVEDRDNAGAGQWDFYARVLDQEPEG